MNEKIDLTKILKNCPKSTELYSVVHGEVEFQQIELSFTYPIVIKLQNEIIERFTPDGKLLNNYNGECILFPSRDQRDWSKFAAPWYKKEKFDPQTLKPFDRVLVRDFKTCKWRCEHFSYFKEDDSYPYMCSTSHTLCIPYNDETKHLVGTKEEAPEYYKYWED